MRPVLGRMGKTSDNQGVDYFLGKSKCFGYPCIAFRDAWVVI